MTSSRIDLVSSYPLHISFRNTSIEFQHHCVPYRSKWSEMNESLIWYAKQSVVSTWQFLHHLTPILSFSNPAIHSRFEYLIPITVLPRVHLKELEIYRGFSYLVQLKILVNRRSRESLIESQVSTQNQYVFLEKVLSQ